MDGYLHRELVAILDEEAGQAEYLHLIAEKLKDQGYVEDSYEEAITQREKEFPTGLQTSSIGVAIPHTDPQHIKKPFISILKLNKPVRFGQMGTIDQFVDVSYLFMLGFEKGEHQLILLQNLMKMFTDEIAMEKLINSNDEAEIYQIVTDYYGSMTVNN